MSRRMWWTVVVTATVLAWSVVMTVLGQVAAIATLIPPLSLLVQQVLSSGGREPAPPAQPPLTTAVEQGRPPASPPAPAGGPAPLPEALPAPGGRALPVTAFPRAGADGGVR